MGPMSGLGANARDTYIPYLHNPCSVTPRRTWVRTVLYAPADSVAGCGLGSLKPLVQGTRRECRVGNHWFQNRRRST